jgi:hypothetical protein
VQLSACHGARIYTLHSAHITRRTRTRTASARAQAGRRGVRTKTSDLSSATPHTASCSKAPALRAQRYKLMQLYMPSVAGQVLHPISGNSAHPQRHRRTSYVCRRQRVYNYAHIASTCGRSTVLWLTNPRGCLFNQALARIRTDRPCCSATCKGNSISVSSLAMAFRSHTMVVAWASVGTQGMYTMTVSVATARSIKASTPSSEKVRGKKAIKDIWELNRLLNGVTR